jgi:hypothetical protein
MKGVESDWNERIMKITMKIKDQYPELSNHLTEMPITIPDEKDPEVKIKNLKEYYESLKVMLEKYKIEHEPNS